LQYNLILFLGLVALPFFCGCNQKAKPAGMPDFHPCFITITQGSTPLEGALVRLESKQGGSIGWSIARRKRICLERK